MRFLWLLLTMAIAASILPSAAFGQDKRAIVRITSHGITGTVIFSEKDRSIILSCAHGFVEGGDRRAVPIKIDVPTAGGVPNPVQVGKPRLLALDEKADLSLIELPAGPLAFIPLAQPGQKVSGQVASCGYDQMKWTDGPKIVKTSIVSHSVGIYWTREIPWHGRSGGPLIDTQTCCLFGVVQGYEMEFGRPGRGMYVDGDRIRQFVYRFFPFGCFGPRPRPTFPFDDWRSERDPRDFYRPEQWPGYGPEWPRVQPQIQIEEFRDRTPFPTSPMQTLPAPYCPDGRCPVPSPAPPMVSPSAPTPYGYYNSPQALQPYRYSLGFPWR